MHGEVCSRKDPPQPEAHTEGGAGSGSSSSADSKRQSLDEKLDDCRWTEQEGKQKNENTKDLKTKFRTLLTR